MSTNTIKKMQVFGLKGPQGPKGDSGVYVGSGDMPDGYNVQIDPEGENDELVTKKQYNKLKAFINELVNSLDNCFGEYEEKELIFEAGPNDFAGLDKYTAIPGYSYRLDNTIDNVDFAIGENALTQLEIVVERAYTVDVDNMITRNIVPIDSMNIQEFTDSGEMAINYTCNLSLYNCYFDDISGYRIFIGKKAELTEDEAFNGSDKNNITLLCNNKFTTFKIYKITKKTNTLGQNIQDMLNELDSEVS